MHQRYRFPAALAVIAIVLVACSPSSGGPTVGSGPPATPASQTPAPATPASQTPAPAPSASPTGKTPQPSATGSGDPAVVVPGEFTVCVPGNAPLRSGTDEQLVVHHPDGDMTVERQRGYTWAGLITSTDLRFSGTHYYSWDGDVYNLASGAEGPSAYAEGLRIENAKGAWQGAGIGATLPDGTTAGSPVVLTGEGEYEGLTAVLFWMEGSCFFDFRGLIMEFPDPPVPATIE